MGSHPRFCIFCLKKIKKYDISVVIAKKLKQNCNFLIFVLLFGLKSDIINTLGFFYGTNNS